MENNIQKKINEGLYEWIVMPFGLTNDPIIFMRLMNKVLKYFIGKIIIAYFDNILVYRKTNGEHLRYLKMMLRRLQQDKLLINLKKYSFMKIELVYLGFVISPNGLKKDPKKVRDIKDSPSLRSVFEVISSHGLDCFYRKFIINFSNICAPIVYTIKKEHG